MPVNLVALRTELTTDPVALGYAPFVTNRQDAQLTAILNWVRDGITVCPVNAVLGATITIRRSDIAVKDVYAAIDVSDYTALPATPTATQLSLERRYLSWLSGLAAMDTIRLLNDDGTDGPVIANFKAMFAAGTGTLNRLQALATRFGSRAEALFGPGTTVSDFDIGRALN